MKISASIYSSDREDLTSLVKQLDAHRVDCFHIDCNDDIAVFDDIEKIRQISDTPIDLHVITDTPSEYYDPINALEIEYATFQYEHLEDPLQVPPGFNARLGLAIVSETPIDVFETYKDQCDFVLMMTTVPGQSGGEFRKENFKKIRKFKARFPGVEVHVDGGVNEEVSFILRNMGIDQVVSGSYLVNHDSMGAALVNLKTSRVKSHYYVRDFMVELPETPILENNQSLDFEDVLDTIEHYQMGLTILTDEQRKLEGIITNADMRRGLKKCIDDLNNIDVSVMINRDPVIINQNTTVKGMIELVKKQKFPILYLPVVNDAQRVVGIVLFNNLIKGEL